jgi:response regulator RpfG family c-di-GMP phosphodiesterase
VLCVDDEANILSALKRMLRGGGHVVVTAGGGAEALRKLEEVPVDLVISDMRMPGMDGAQLLEQVRQRWPHVVRILLTGHADMGSTVAAINRGQIFRYVHKPWDEGDLLAAVDEGLGRLRLQREKDRLEALTQQQNGELKSLNTELESRVQARTAELAEAHKRLETSYLKSIKVFSNLLELRGAHFAGHGRRVAQTARDIARFMQLPEEEVRRIFVAGMLHDIGLIGAADRLLSRPVARYSDEDLALYRQHPVQAEATLMALDDMQPLMPLIRGHHERWDGHGFPDRLAGSAIPLGARILAIADAFDDLQQGVLAETRLTAAEARTVMRAASGSQFDPDLLTVFFQVTEPAKPKAAPLPLRSDQLEAGMVLAQDLVSARGLLMLTAGHVLTASLIARMREFEAREGGKLEIHIKPRAGA